MTSPPASAPDSLNIHGTCVAWQGRGLLIIGASGSGKSSLGLELMAYGAGLVADDRTILTRQDDAILCAPPPATAGRIEARFLGILNAAPAPPALPVRLAIVLDLDHIEESRLPLQRSVTYLTLMRPLIYRPQGGHLAAAVLQYLKAGRSEP